MTPVSWFDALHRCQQLGQGYVLLTVMASAGSTPRSQGTKMLVTAEQIYDTIGGGHLEHSAIATARELLAHGNKTQHIEHYPLASKLGQCCGGATNILFEVFNQHVQQVLVFGAGHVAKALLPIISQLPLQISWVDNRTEMFDLSAQSANVHCIEEIDPESVLDAVSTGAWVVVITHDHQLDFTIVERALANQDIQYIGMIGSSTKAKRFITRLTRKGVAKERLDAFFSPIGLSNVPGKKPIEVAVSIAGQIIQMLHSDSKPSTKEQAKAAWLQTKKIASLL